MTPGRPSSAARLIGRLLTGALGLLSILVLAWGYWPPRHQVSSLVFQPGEATAPFIDNVRSVELSYPSRIRIRDSAVVQLRVGLAEHLDPTLLATAPRIGEARLELPGADVRPPDAISVALPPGEQLNFMWQIIPLEPGALHGTAWLVLIDHEGAGNQNRVPVSAQSMEIEAQTLGGMSGPAARLIGGLGTVTNLIGVLALAQKARRIGESSGRVEP